MSSKGRAAPATAAGRDYGAAGGELRGGLVSYGDADPEGLRDCIESVTLAGDAVLFARTSDGGALSVRILSSGRTFMHYPTTSEGLNELLTELTRISQE